MHRKEGCRQGSWGGKWEEVSVPRAQWEPGEVAQVEVREVSWVPCNIKKLVGKKETPVRGEAETRESRESCWRSSKRSSTGPHVPSSPDTWATKSAFVLQLGFLSPKPELWLMYRYIWIFKKTGRNYVEILTMMHLGYRIQFHLYTFLYFLNSMCWTCLTNY